MKEDEGKAIGAACRQSGRAIEDCFSLNRSALKAAVFAGWKDMNDYMAQNKIETAQPEADASSPTDDNADTSTSAPAAAKKKKITAIRPKK
ncbi:MAG TPA: hypothetical protein VFW00_04765 [Rhodocyclaceae bacterium]|nr:hypothetical protein [Rhodocyclaceae bacterium]